MICNNRVYLRKLIDSSGNALSLYNKVVTASSFSRFIWGGVNPGGMPEEERRREREAFLFGCNCNFKTKSKHTPLDLVLFWFCWSTMQRTLQKGGQQCHISLGLGQLAKPGRSPMRVGFTNEVFSDKWSPPCAKLCTVGHHLFQFRLLCLKVMMAIASTHCRAKYKYVTHNRPYIHFKDIRPFDGRQKMSNVFLK